MVNTKLILSIAAVAAPLVAAQYGSNSGSDNSAPSAPTGYGGGGSGAATLPQALKDYIVDAHNTARRTKAPFPAANMLKMEWSDYLAGEANNLVAQCQFQHHTNGYGQNLFMTSAGGIDDSTFDQAMKGWVDDELCNDTPRMSASNIGNGIYDHASQVLWGASYQVGCGFAKCSDGVHVFCNYLPAGNMVGQQWYISGETCSQCPSGSGYCDNGLCCEHPGNSTTVAPVSVAPEPAPVPTSEPTPCVTSAAPISITPEPTPCVTSAAPISITPEPTPCVTSAAPISVTPEPTPAPTTVAPTTGSSC